jgi:nucleotide-binding universal stress UspA family protein
MSAPSKKILVPVDGSENSRRALEQAVSIAKGGAGASVTIVHVVERPPTVYVESQKLLDELLARYRQESEKVLGEFEAHAEKLGLKVESVVMEGDAATNIVSYADKGKFDMIVMGSRGLGRFREAVLGSVSSKVLHHARCPVLIVK